MKQRLVSAAVGIVILAAVLCLYDTLVLPVAVAALSGMAVYEALYATHFAKDKLDALLCVAFAVFSIILPFVRPNDSLLILVILFAIILLGMILTNSHAAVRQVILCMAFTAVLPLAFSVVFHLEGRFYLILACIAAWVPDAGAYFVGRACGKTKLAPSISPNKTVEGAFGGLLLNAAIFPLVCMFFWSAALPNQNFSALHAVIIAVLCGISGALGDLFFSAIKRKAGIKDYGNIMPGHGGILDRFDSFLFAAPTLYVLLQIMPIFT